MATEKGVEIHLKNAKMSDLDSQVAELRESYTVYRTMRKVTRQPGELSLSYNIRAKEGASSGKGLTTARLQADAAKFRILNGIRDHVNAKVGGDLASFDLAFDLSCRRIPDLINPEEIVVGSPVVG